MSEAEELIEDMSEMQKVIVLLIDANNQEPISGKTPFEKELFFQKELFVIAKNTPKIEKEASFDSDYFGPFSENAKEELEELALNEVVNDNGKTIKLSKLGKEVAEKLKKKSEKEILVLISDFKDLMNNMTKDELLTFIYFSFPDYTDESLVLEQIKKNRLSVAKKLYKKQKISASRAAEIAGISLEDFLKSVQK